MNLAEPYHQALVSKLSNFEYIKLNGEKNCENWNDMKIILLFVMQLLAINDW